MSILLIFPFAGLGVRLAPNSTVSQPLEKIRTICRLLSPFRCVWAVRSFTNEIFSLKTCVKWLNLNSYLRPKNERWKISNKINTKLCLISLSSLLCYLINYLITPQSDLVSDWRALTPLPFLGLVIFTLWYLHLLPYTVLAEYSGLKMQV